MKTHDHESLLLFDEQLPFDGLSEAGSFKSECPPDKVFKTENLFKFRRGRGDYHASIAAALLAVAFLALFWTQTGWENRKLPDNLGNYVAYQFGLAEIEGRKKRLGTILNRCQLRNRQISGCTRIRCLFCSVHPDCSCTWLSVFNTSSRHVSDLASRLSNTEVVVYRFCK